jgi:hypothetical protein
MAWVLIAGESFRDYRRSRILVAATSPEVESSKSYIQVMLPAIPDKRLQLLFIMVKMIIWFAL